MLIPQNRSALLRHFNRLISVAAAILILVGSSRADANHASAFAAQVQAGKSVTVDVDGAEFVQLDEPATNIFVANPDIADVQAPNQTSFLLLGKKAGTTTAYAITQSGRTVGYSVTVRRAFGNLVLTLRKEVPDADIKVTGTPNGVIISGEVSSPSDALRLKVIARDYLGEKEEVTSNVTVREATEVNLQVRVAEVSRQANKQFGFNWSAIYNNGTFAFGLLTGRSPIAGGFGAFLPSTAAGSPNSVGFGYQSSGHSANISTLIDALASEGLVTVLAQPNLTAVSGETANFLAGGEFPVPIAQGLNQISIEFKRFGVSVDFTPTVLGPNRMSIKVRPEVSELSDQGSITLSNIKIPGLIVRRAQTTVELASGQSFAIAGLFQNNASTSVSRIPWLGDVPILGPLFRSDSFQRNESELVIIVTPYIVRPVSRPGDLSLPTAGLEFASDLDRLLHGQLTASHKGAGELPRGIQDKHLRGPAGFMLEDAR